MLPDRWNPRVWLRDWINAPTKAERQACARQHELLQELLDEIRGLRADVERISRAASSRRGTIG